MVHILDENQIKENYEKFRKLINQTFKGERLEALNKMYDHLEDRIILTPLINRTLPQRICWWVH